MNWKGVMSYFKEKEFGLDRWELAEAETSPVAPDGFCEDEIIFVRNDDGTEEAVEIFVPPARSTATRMPPARTKGHSRGAMVEPEADRAVTFASAHEWRSALILMASPEIAEVYDQPPAITYIDAEGKKVKHTPDYLAVSRSGKKCAIAVKPSRRVERSGVVDTIDRIRPILGDYADDIILLTEIQLTPERANNAESVLHANSCRVQADCDRVAAIMETTDGEVNAYDIAKLFGDFPRGMNAIWCLVYDGVVKLADPARMLADNPFVFRVKTVVMPVD